MKNKLLLITSSIGLMIGLSNAATISLTRGTGNPGIIASLEGTSLTAGGYYVAVGTYTTSGTTQVPLITTDPASLLAAVAAFDTFASLVAPIGGSTIGTITGSFTSLGNVGGNTPADFNLKPIYFLVGNAATAAGSTAWGIFSMTTSSAFPADVTAAGSTPVSIPRGASITPLMNAGIVTGDTFALVNTVPEPSAVFLGAIGALGLLRRRRN